jgi:LmbE family N-acetylglucosaminyl deacetylase
VKKLFFPASARILVLAPHPDDESIGCGGLLLKFPSQCDVAVLTDGRYGGLSGQSETNTIATRKLELEKAMVYAGVKNYLFLGVEDGKLSKNFAKFSALDTNGYDAIFCPAPGDNHPDHACIYEFLLRLKPQAKIFAYEVWSALSRPSHYLDVSGVVEGKKKLIAFYKSQVAQVDYASKAIGLNCFRGLLPYSAVQYAEAYQEMKKMKKSRVFWCGLEDGYCEIRRGGEVVAIRFSDWSTNFYPGATLWDKIRIYFL